MSQLVTGEAVALDVRTAGLPSRMLAALIDGVIQSVVLFLLFLLVAAFASDGNDAATAALLITVYVASGLGYPVLLETLMRGRTPGKAAMGLRVVRDDAGPIGFRQAFVRGLVGFIVERPGISLYAGAVITSLAREDGKRLGDLMAGTIVVQERIVSTQTPPALMPPQLLGWATTLDLSRLPDDLALSVRTFLARGGDMTEHARAELGGRLVAAVSAVVSPPPPNGTPPWAYLSAVLAERRRRAEAVPASAPVNVAPPAVLPQPLPPPSETTPPPTRGGFAPPA